VTTRAQATFDAIRKRLRALRIGRYGLALALILVVGLVLRLIQIGSDGLWLDEAYSVALANMSIIDMVRATAGDVHPPLYYFLLHYWVMAFGDSEIAVRLLSVVFGIAAIPVIYELGRLLFNREAGLVGALVLALSVFQIFYSQDARMYSLLVLLSLLSLYFFVLYLQRPCRLILVAYVLVTVLLLYTDVYGLFVVIVEPLKRSRSWANRRLSHVVEQKVASHLSQSGQKIKAPEAG